MTDAELQSLTDIQLAECFEAVCMEAGKHKGSWNTRIINPLISKQFNVRKELERRGPQSLGLLLPLLDHPDRWVRFYAAVACLPLDRQRCLAMLWAFYESMDGSISADAVFVLLDCDPEFRAKVQTESYAESRQLLLDKKLKEARWAP